MTAFMLRQAQHEANFIGPVYSVTFTLSSVTFTLRSVMLTLRSVILTLRSVILTLRSVNLTLRSVILTLSLSKGEGPRRRGYCQGGSELL